MHFKTWLNLSVTVILALILPACKDHNKTSNSTAENVLILTDIHFDPYTSCGESTDPVAQLCVQNLVNQSDPNAWSFPSNISANSYSRDTNNALFQAELQQLIPYVNAKHITKVFLLGDLLSHNFQNNFASYVPGGTQQQLTNLSAYTINYVISNIVKATHAKIYYVLGNNDTDTADYKFPTATFMQQLVSLISPYMADPAAFAQTFGSGGYSVMSLNGNTNVIGLNFNPLTSQNENTPSEIVLANQQFNWLDQQLDAARKQNKKVIILHHEPFGINTFNVATGMQPSNPEYVVLNPTLQALYLNEYSNYSNIINNYYYGHYHMESIQVAANIFSFSTLAFNVLFNNNPGFKIIALNQQGQLQNYTTFYSDYSNSQIQWQALYSLNSTYHVLPQFYVIFFSLFPANQNSAPAMNYINYYNGLNTIPSMQQPISQPGKWVYFYCGMNYMTIADYQNCLASF